MEETDGEPSRHVVTLQEIQNIRDSKRHPKLDVENRRIRTRYKSEDGWERFKYIELQRDASNAEQIADWAPFEYADLKSPRDYDHYKLLIAEELFQALGRIWEFRIDRTFPELYPEHPDGEDVEIPGTLAEIAQFLEAHKARIDWDTWKLIYEKEAA